MRLSRFALVPLMLLGSACGVETMDAEVPSSVDAQDSSLSVKAEGRGLQQLKAQRPDFLVGVGELSTRRVLKDQRGQSHERVAQSFKGVPVFGAQAILHLGADGSVESVTDKLVRNLRVETTPKLRAAEATQIALGRVSNAVGLVGTPKADLVILPESGSARLTYHVQLDTITADGQPSRPNLFIDAQHGRARLGVRQPPDGP